MEVVFETLKVSLIAAEVEDSNEKKWKIQGSSLPLKKHPLASQVEVGDRLQQLDVGWHCLLVRMVADLGWEEEEYQYADLAVGVYATRVLEVVSHGHRSRSCKIQLEMALGTHKENLVEVGE